MKLLSRLFISIGILLYILGVYNIWLVKNPHRLAFSKYTYAKQVQNAQVMSTVASPVRIIVKNQQIDLPLVPSSIVNNEWETTTQGASYLESSPIPGEKGNSIVYGHNWASLFGNLVNVAPGDEVQIEYEDKSTKTFVIKYTSVVTPETASILAPTEDKRITLYTCVGFLDSHRFVAVATLKEKL